jgi:hypothetical protein
MNMINGFCQKCYKLILINQAEYYNKTAHICVGCTKEEKELDSVFTDAIMVTNSERLREKEVEEELEFILETEEELTLCNEELSTNDIKEETEEELTLSWLDELDEISTEGFADMPLPKEKKKPECDCGAKIAKTLHAIYCSVYKEDK